MPPIAYLKTDCEHCSGHIEYPSELAGQSIACPHCQLNTALPSPFAPPPRSQPPAIVATGPPPQYQSGSDTVFFRSGQLVVTRTRFIVGSQMYAISNITSVRFVRFPADNSDQIAITVIGLILALIGIGTVSSSNGSNWAVMLVFGGLSLVGGIACFRRAFLAVRAKKDWHAVSLVTAAGEVMAYKSQDEDLMLLLIDALNQAIAARG